MKAVDDQPVWSVICFCCAGRVPRPTLTHATDVVADREVPHLEERLASRHDLAEAVDAGDAVAAVPLHRREGRGAAAGASSSPCFGASAVLPPHQEPASIGSTGWCCEPSWPGWHWRSSASLFPAPRTSATSGCSRCSTWRSAGGGAGAAARHPGGRPISAPDDCGVGYPCDGVARRPHPLRRPGPSAAQPLPLSAKVASSASSTTSRRNTSSWGSSEEDYRS